MRLGKGSDFGEFSKSSAEEDVWLEQIDGPRSYQGLKFVLPIEAFAGGKRGAKKVVGFGHNLVATWTDRFFNKHRAERL